MTDKKKLIAPKLPRGFEDRLPAEIAAVDEMVSTIRKVYERYGFDPVETPLFEYTETLGKFLPDTDRPNAGVFSLQDDDEQWMSLRYDLTAPLARVAAQYRNDLPSPYRRYAMGPVWRNEKPGPGRFRQFMQFDADTVGSASPAADAEMCMMAADTMEALGVPRGSYVVKVNNRKVLDGVLEAIGLGGEDNAGRRLTVLRAIDKLDRFGVEGVRLLLGKGRKDESGDFTKGADLPDASVDIVIATCAASFDSSMPFPTVSAESKASADGVAELKTIQELVRAAGYDKDRIKIDPSVVRGLEYYTGPVYEAELLAEIPNEDGQIVRFGSVGGGGRYDGLVGRFMKDDVPATGFSIGVSRLYSALKLVGKAEESATLAPVVVLVMDKAAQGDYWRMVQELRSNGIRAEMYVGTAGMKAQMKYADKRNAPCVLIQGSDERAKGEVTLKDLIEGAKAAAAIKDNKEWKAARPAQLAVPEANLVDEVRKIIDRHTS